MAVVEAAVTGKELRLAYREAVYMSQAAERRPAAPVAHFRSRMGLAAVALSQELLRSQHESQHHIHSDSLTGTLPDRVADMALGTTYPVLLHSTGGR